MIIEEIVSNKSDADIIRDLTVALHDAIRRPMGVVPKSAEPFVTDEGLAAAEKRRPRSGGVPLSATPRPKGNSSKF